MKIQTGTLNHPIGFLEVLRRSSVSLFGMGPPGIVGKPTESLFSQFYIHEILLNAVSKH